MAVINIVSILEETIDLFISDVIGDFSFPETRFFKVHGSQPCLEVRFGFDFGPATLKGYSSLLLSYSPNGPVISKRTNTDAGDAGDFPYDGGWKNGVVTLGADPVLSNTGISFDWKIYQYDAPIDGNDIIGPNATVIPALADFDWSLSAGSWTSGIAAQSGEADSFDYFYNPVSPDTYYGAISNANTAIVNGVNLFIAEPDDDNGRFFQPNATMIVADKYYMGYGTPDNKWRIKTFEPQSPLAIPPDPFVAVYDTYEITFDNPAIGIGQATGQLSAYHILEGNIGIDKVAIILSLDGTTYKLVRIKLSPLVQNFVDTNNGNIQVSFDEDFNPIVIAQDFNNNLTYFALTGEAPNYVPNPVPVDMPCFNGLFACVPLIKGN